ncbi:hypothetical protein ACTMS0_14900 [Micromonospora sp. H33]|uniref:hypothetical protein n=1 Tax=Micromonospora sp. H33 TaxID=3452215 RepID=UPI003F8B3A7C
MATVSSTPRREGLVGRLNGRHHRAALTAYLVVVIGHWAEHLVQAYQIWVLGMPRPQSRGVLGQWFPWLVSSEWLHYGYALVMLVGLFLLQPGFTGRSRTWWTVALALQFWHHLEHLLLFVQAQTGTYLFGQAVPTSVIQLLVGRVELHLFYNSVVFIPMVIAMYRHLRPSDPELHAASCSCLAAQKRNLGLPAAPAPA